MFQNVFVALRGVSAALLFAMSVRAATPPDPAGWQSLYKDDFERTVLSGWQGGLENAQIVKEGGNSVLAVTAHTKLMPQSGYYRDLHFKARVKLVDSTTVSLEVRGLGCAAYAAYFSPGGADLVRGTDCSSSARVASQPGSFEIGRWYTVELVARGARVQVYLDGDLRFDFNDPAPIPAGGIALMVHQSGNARFDDLEVSGPPDTGALTWVRTGGPHGGVGYDIRMRPDNPDSMMVTDISSGVTISTDGGKTWQPSNQGILSRTGVSGDAVPIFCLTIDSNRPDTVWAGTQNMRGIYKSTDGGKTWAQKDQGIIEKNGITFRGFTVDPRDSRTVYAAAEISSFAWAGESRQGRIFDLTKGVVYKTTDGGENWNAVWRGDSLARYIWIDPRNSNVVYVSTGFFDRESANSDPARNIPGGVGILKSTDGGRSWRALDRRNGLASLCLPGLFMHPANPDILIAAAGCWWEDGVGVYLTSDGGETWRNTLPSGPPIQSVEFSTSAPRIAYAAGNGMFYRSRDGALTWELMAGPGFGPPGSQSGFPADLQVDPRNPDRVFVNGYSGGNMVTADGGRTWSEATVGYTGASLNDIAVDPADPTRVYTVTRVGPERSDNAGAAWTGLFAVPRNSSDWDPVGFNWTEWFTVAVDPRDPQKVLFASEINGTLLLSTSRGRDWKIVYRDQRVNPVLPADYHGFRSIAFAPSNHDVIYAGMSHAGGVLDSGGAGPSYGVFRSTDGGQTWREANDANTARENVLALAVDPRSPSIVYAGTHRNGVLVSTDGGGKWQPLNTGLKTLDIRSLAIDPSNPFVIYAGTQLGGLYKTTNAGASWLPINAGMNPGAVVRDIAIDPTNSQVVFAADYGSGVYRSEDGGKLWIQINQGLTMRAVKALSISSGGSTLYAATDGGGVYRLDLKPRNESALSVLPAASFLKDGPAAPDSIVSLYGAGLAAALAQAATTTLPSTLGETQVSLTDSDGVDAWAPLYFVSPGQINFVVPATAKTGPTQVRVFRQNKVIARGTVQIDPAAPGIFTASANGQGVPAALAARYSASGAQTAVPVFQCAATCTPAALDLGAAGDQLILMLYGTGLRNARSVSVTIGGVDAPVLGFAAQSQYPGLDQVNIRVPRELKGRGDVDLILKADGKAANAVKIRMQ